jgi:hypothetical protein
MGMVGVINPANNTNITKQIQAAKSANIMLAPGQPWPAEGSQPGALSSISISTSTPTSTSTSTSTPGASHGHNLSGGAIAGIAIGAACVVLLCAALCYFVGRSNSYSHIMKLQHRSDGAPSQVGDGQAAPWSPAPNSPGLWSNRMSGQTQTGSPQMAQAAGQGGTFIGFNRHTGEPEFAMEAPTEAQSNEKDMISKGHPAFGPGSTQGTTYELPGEEPERGEMGPYK